MKALFGLVLASALTLPTVGVMANVVYGLHEVAVGSDRFVGTLTLPDFISTDTTFPVSDFSVSINAFPWTTVEFKPNISTLTCSVDFGLSSCDFLSLTNGLGPFDFYGYAPGTFEKVGTNTSTNGALSLELTVSQTSVVPEPSTWAMMLVGFAGLGFAGYRKLKSVAAFA
jgi:PEP-CTERM motif